MRLFSALFLGCTLVLSMACTRATKVGPASPDLAAAAASQGHSTQADDLVIEPVDPTHEGDGTHEGDTDLTIDGQRSAGLSVDLRSEAEFMRENGPGFRVTVSVLNNENGSEIGSQAFCMGLSSVDGKRIYAGGQIRAELAEGIYVDVERARYAAGGQSAFLFSMAATDEDGQIVPRAYFGDIALMQSWDVGKTNYFPAKVGGQTRTVRLTAEDVDTCNPAETLSSQRVRLGSVFNGFGTF